jgi:Na+-driven multidrug efflux pump
VLPHSLAYTHIRALGFPAVTVTMVLQGACLANKDVATPLKACAVSAVVNLVGDIVLVFAMGWGIKGAAAATTFAQVRYHILQVLKYL